MLRLTRTNSSPEEEQDRNGAVLAAVGAWLQNSLVIAGGLVSLLALIAFRSRRHG